MDKNGKIAGKISIVDILVIFLIIVVAAGIAARYGSSITDSVKSEKQFEYVIKVEGVREYTVRALEKMGKITDKKSEKDLGEIIDVTTEPATMQSTTVNGEIVNAEVPERYACYVKIRAKGKESADNYILADSTELSVGGTTDLYSKYVKTSGTIKSVTVVE